MCDERKAAAANEDWELVGKHNNAIKRLVFKGKEKYADQFLRYFCFRPFSVLSESLCFDPLRRSRVQWRVYKKRDFLVFFILEGKSLDVFFTHSLF
jgi:hypothetical protein